MADDLKLKANAFKSGLKPIWCPGCGDFGVLASAYRAFAELDLDPDNTVIVSGIGCSSRFPGFVATYGFHGVHGRALPDGDGREAREPGPERDRGRRRRRRLRDRRRPLPARRAPQRRHHLHHHEQPDLRPHQGPGVADLAARPEVALDAVRQPRGADERARHGDRRRLLLRRAGRELPLQGADRADRRGHPPSRLQLHRRLQPLHRVQQHHAGVEGSRLQPARRARLLQPAGRLCGRAVGPDGHRHLLPLRAARRSTAGCARCRRPRRRARSRT